MSKDADLDLLLGIYPPLALRANLRRLMSNFISWTAQVEPDPSLRGG